ncbi:hypothetical protein APZ15_25905 [Burkholderia cepacia ATCC 25416]|nr:hypothetical protein APZ15_25905 [Burkholderia cepacia ATCC 25416]
MARGVAFARHRLAFDLRAGRAGLNHRATTDAVAHARYGSTVDGGGLGAADDDTFTVDRTAVSVADEYDRSHIKLLMVWTTFEYPDAY